MNSTRAQYCKVVSLVLAMTLEGMGMRMALADESTDPTLTFVSQEGQIQLSRSELLRRFALETIQVESDPAYPCQNSRYQAVKMAAVLAQFEIEPEVEVQFIADDRYKSWVPITQLRNTGGTAPIAYLAIEDPQNQWPRLPDGKRVGPFYLVWIKQQQNTGGTAWPWSINTIDFTPDSDEQLALPAESLALNDPARLGYQVYRMNCKPCHTMNGSGSERRGPDLNLPLNPTEYFRDGMLRQLIRDPGSVRKISGSAMGVFGKEKISDAELDQLLAYLQHMATRKPVTN